MPQARWVKEAIAGGNAFHFRAKNRWAHNALNLGCLGVLLAAGGALAVAATRWSPVFLPLAGIAFGVIFFALIILVVHEGSHGMFVLSRNRLRRSRWNRFFGWAVAVPFGIHYTKDWERGHLIHHLHPIEADDPQVNNLRTGRALVAIVLKMVLIPGYVFFFTPGRGSQQPRWLALASAAFWISAWSIGALVLSWKVAAALVLGLGALGGLNQVKGSLEHGGAIAREPNRNVRSRTSLFALRWLVMPFNISLHFEHHLNYCVPWYSLPRYHRALRSIVPPGVAREVFNHRVWDQLMGRIGGLSDATRLLVESSP